MDFIVIVLESHWKGQLREYDVVYVLERSLQKLCGEHSL